MSTGNGAVGLVRLGSSLGRLVVTTTVLGSAVAMLTATVVNVALPALADDLDASSAGQQWVVNGYLVTLSSLILVGGALGDRLGRVRVYRIGVAWFAVASIVCAAAPSLEVLLAARLAQGVGGALLTPGSLAIIEATLDPADRGRGVGAWSGLTGIAGAIGPLVGGLLVEASWRLVFLLNVPLAVAVLALSIRVPESLDRDARALPLDGLGAGLTVATLGGASYALIEARNTGGAAPVTAGVVAVGALIALFVRERDRRGAMVPVDLFADREFAVANLITFLVYGGMGLVFFLLAIQLQVTAGFSALASGAALLPVTALMLALSSSAGGLASRTGPRLPLTAGPLLIAAGMVLFTRIGPQADYLADVLPAVTVFGLGLSASVAPVTATALGSAPDSRAGAASGVNNALARTGQLIAVAAVPPLVGLTGDALSDPAQLDRGFAPAMVVAAGLVTAGALVAAALLKARPADHRTPACCPVDGPGHVEVAARSTT